MDVETLVTSVKSSLLRLNSPLSQRPLLPLVTVGDDPNGYSCQDIVLEASLTAYDPMSDYLDFLIQYSYVIMFTVVWPLLPLPAFLNNLLEVRGDAFRLLFASKRPMPRRDNSIGEWLTVMERSSILAVIVVSGIIYLFQYGFWKDNGCDTTFNEAPFIPFHQFIEETDLNLTEACQAEVVTLNQELLVLLLLEHVGLLLRAVVIQGKGYGGSAESLSVRSAKQKKVLTGLSSGCVAMFRYLAAIREVFDRYSHTSPGFLFQDELLAFCAFYYSLDVTTGLTRQAKGLMAYCDKNQLGKIPFNDLALLCHSVHEDRFLSTCLGLPVASMTAAASSEHEKPRGTVTSDNCTDMAV